MRRHYFVLSILLLLAAMVAGCTTPTAPTPAQDEQITIGPHPDVVSRVR